MNKTNKDCEVKNKCLAGFIEDWSLTTKLLRLNAARAGVKLADIKLMPEEIR